MVARLARRERIPGGQRVAVWRRHFGLTVRGLAVDAGLYYSALSRIEHGKQQATADELERLAAAMGLSMPQFYGELPGAAA